MQRTRHEDFPCSLRSVWPCYVAVFSRTPANLLMYWLIPICFPSLNKNICWAFAMGYDRHLSTSFVLIAYNHSPFYSTRNSFRSLCSLVPRVYTTSHGSNLLACSQFPLNVWDHAVTTRFIHRSLCSIREFSHVFSFLQFMLNM